MVEQMFTRQQILDAITLRPCHITGQHDPGHTPDRVCESQTAKSFRGILELLGIDASDVSELPRDLHGRDCSWCHSIPTQEEHRVQSRRLHEWAGVEVPPELAEPASDAVRPDDVEAYVEAVRKYPGLVGAGYANALGWPIGRVSRVHDEAKSLGLVVTRQVNGTWITYAPEETDG